MIDRFDRFNLESGILESVLILLALITGVIHLQIGYLGNDDLLFLAGAGFLGGAVLFLLGFKRRVVSAIAVPYTAAQILIYYQVYGFNFGKTALLDKTVQVLFIALCIYYLNLEGEWAGKT